MRTAPLQSSITTPWSWSRPSFKPARPAITDAVLREASRALASGHPPHRLHGEIAADLLFDDEGGRVAALRAALAGAPIDIVAQPARQRRKRLFLADMDSTMIAQECIDELADYVGLKTEVAAITERAMRGEIAFEPALREWVALSRRCARGHR